MATAMSGTNVRLTFNVWYDRHTPTQIHITCNDPSLERPSNGAKGAHHVVSSNPKSADFNPGLFNTYRAMLCAAGKPYPEHKANEKIPRRISERLKRGIFTR